MGGAHVKPAWEGCKHWSYAIEVTDTQIAKLQQGTSECYPKIPCHLRPITMLTVRSEAQKPFESMHTMGRVPAYYGADHD